MAQKKYTQLPSSSTEDGSEIIAYVQNGVSVQGTLQKIAKLYGGIISVVTTGATITLAFDNKSNPNFIGATSFATAKAIAHSNDTNGVQYVFIFNVTNVAAKLTFPAGYIMSDVRWEAVNPQEWEPAEIGKYKATATYDGTNWWLEISAAPYV